MDKPFSWVLKQSYPAFVFLVFFLSWTLSVQGDYSCVQRGECYAEKK